MRKIALMLAVVLVMSNFALAASEKEDKIDIPKEWNGKKKVVIPQGELTQVVFIKYKKPSDQVDKPVVDLGDPNRNGASDGYELSGLWWNLKRYTNGVPYTINPGTAVKNYRLTQNAVVGAIKNSMEAWDKATSKELYSNSPAIDNNALSSTSKPDYKNVITWASISDSKIVAISLMWYSSSTKEIVDADMVFNTNYRWGIDADGEGTSYSLSNAFDIQNVGTHEAGHLTALNDLYDSKYRAMTMYGYTTYGEVIKRSLEQGDISGTQAVYGK